MSHDLRPEFLEAMKKCLLDLENAKLISPDDIDIVYQKRVLRQKIDELESEVDDDLAA